MAFILSTDAILEKSSEKSGDKTGFFDPRYTCDVDNSSPELRWSDPPEGTVGFALFAEDIDHPDRFAHWVVFNVPATVRHLPAGIPPQEILPNGIRQGLNSWGKLGYAGPCPPPRSQAHTYVFRLVALSALPEITHRPTRDELMSLLAPYIVATAEIRGRYQRMIQIAG
jgi:Raf kinase inhibitor-like YbhB/YbcL family protein